jgi:SAM-dependent methyltransferase
VTPERARGRLFDDIADLYDQVRPDYPSQVYELVSSVRPLAGARVVDLAAGTGIASRQLRERGAEVVATDPGVEMLTRLRARRRDVAAVAARAERLPFAAASFDLATCATGWHWIETAAAVAELRRVLRPGGAVALWWANHLRAGDIAWETAQDEVFRRWSYRSGSRPTSTAGVGPREAAADLRGRGLEVLVDTEVTWSRTVARDVHLHVLATHSDTLALGAEAARLLDEVEEALQPWAEVEERLWGPVVVARFPT